MLYNIVFSNHTAMYDDTIVCINVYFSVRCDTIRFGKKKKKKPQLLPMWLIVNAEYESSEKIKLKVNFNISIMFRVYVDSGGYLS